MATTTTYTRTYSFFDPTITYEVSDQYAGNVGAVARDGRRWRASSRGWTKGGTLRGTFATRRAAARALIYIREGQASPDMYGGYVPRMHCAACGAVLVREEGELITWPGRAAGVQVREFVGPWLTTANEAICHPRESAMVGPFLHDPQATA